MELKNFRLSKSSVLTYIQCPKKFLLQNVQKIQTPDTPALAKGKEFHKVGEEFFKHRVDIEVMKEEIMRLPEALNHPDAVEKFAKFAAHVSKDGKTIMVPFITEQKMYDDRLNFSGIVDAVFVDGDEVLILDYKTGQMHPIEKYRFELSMYKYLFEAQGGLKITHWGIFFVDHPLPNSLVVEKANYMEVQKSINIVRETRMNIAKGNFEKRPSWLCKSCQYRISGHCSGQIGVDP